VDRIAEHLVPRADSVTATPLGPAEKLAAVGQGAVSRAGVASGDGDRFAGTSRHSSTPRRLPSRETNRFWPAFSRSRLSKRARTALGVAALRRLRRFGPRVACFHGLTGSRPFLRDAALGPQPEAIGATRLFVVPNLSAASAHFTPADQTAWYDRLAAFL